MIRKLLALVFNRWVLIAVGLLALALVIWIVGPLVAIGDHRPLETAIARWIAIAAAVLLAALRMAWRAWRARCTNQQVVQQLVMSAAPQQDNESPEIKELRERFEQALQTLRHARFESIKGWWACASARAGKRYLYELPWYIIIGAPGSGKTTALKHSGLRFPLADEGGNDATIKGVGGTRNCKWWFSDEAVLIDTAGRYATQDSDRAADAQAWNGFLELLRNSRPRQPINGVLLTVSVTDLLTQTASQRQAHADELRKRVQELHERLGVRLPIYLLVTKCDLLAGFVDYLGNVDKEQRISPWGFSFPLDAQGCSDASRYEAEFDALDQRLNDGLIERLQPERDIARRARIYAFPQQFSTLRNVLKEWIDGVFTFSRFAERPLLRGVYFVSGTQKGTPIDRALGAMARSLGIEGAVAPPNVSSGKSYFLERLLREVVFAESGLGGTNLKWERRRGALALAGYSLVGVVVAVALLLWGRSWLGNRAYVDRVDARVDRVRDLVQTTPNRASPELLPLLPALQATRDLAVSEHEDGVPWSLGFGLYQGDKLDAASRRAYERMLVDAVLPRIALRVEEHLKTSASDPELQYEALKTYVMLHEPQRFDAKSLRAYVLADQEASLPRSVTTEQRAELTAHLDALLALGPVVSPLPQNKALMAQVRAMLASVPLPQRVYSRLKREGLGDNVSPFTIARAAGNAAGLVYRRASGEPLTQGVPGLYTYDGYHQAFQRQVEGLTRQLVDEEGWVLGLADTAPPKTAPRDVLSAGRDADEVRRLYLNDYARTWERFITDIRLQPVEDVAKAIQTARVLSSPDTPLRPLVKALVHETTLGVSPGKSAIDKAEDAAKDALGNSKRTLESLFGKRPAQGAVADGARIESIVDERPGFVALRRLVPAPGTPGPAPLDNTIALIEEVYTMLVAADTAIRGGNVPPVSEVPNKVKAQAAQQPEPVRSLLDTLGRGSMQVTLAAVGKGIDAKVNTDVGAFCRTAVAGRYPLVRTSARDARPDDFARLFAPGGLMDEFFQKQLAPFVDTSRRPWTRREVAGATAAVDAASLMQFQRAADIRDTFFPGGGKTLSYELKFKPVVMDATITHFTLDVDGQFVRYSHGPAMVTRVQWPGPQGSGQVRISLLPPPPSGPSAAITEGPWALFRLFDQAAIQPGSAPDRFQVTFDIGGRKASFEVTANSVQNPFRLQELGAFSCPGQP